MPTYDYRCDRCHEQFELWQSFSDDTLVRCPVEGGPAACETPGHGRVKKVFSRVGIAFKGDGFYKNDYGASATGRAEESESTSSSKSEDSSDSKSNDSSSNGTSTGSSSSASSDPGSSKKEKNKSSDSESVSTSSATD